MDVWSYTNNGHTVNPRGYDDCDQQTRLPHCPRLWRLTAMAHKDNRPWRPPHQQITQIHMTIPDVTIPANILANFKMDKTVSANPWQQEIGKSYPIYMLPSIIMGKAIYIYMPRVDSKVRHFEIMETRYDKIDGWTNRRMSTTTCLSSTRRKLAVLPKISFPIRCQPFEAFPFTKKSLGRFEPLANYIFPSRKSAEIFGSE